jgi:hypothetical protein
MYKVSWEGAGLYQLACDVNRLYKWYETYFWEEDISRYII